MHKKGHKVSRKRTMRKTKGGYYGMSGSIAPGAALWTRGSEMGDWAVSNRGANAQYGSGKKRKGVKKTQKRKHRGGGKYGGVSASYQGSGSRGLADHVGIITRDGTGAAAQGAFNNFGAQPGSGFGSFIKAN
jgi:hypothetical protein